jgi:cytochrome c553
MSRFILRVLIGTAVALSVSFAAFAQSKAPDAAPHVGQAMDNAIALCIGCHGLPGYKTAFPVVYHVPRIAGQQPGYLLNALKAYKSGERSHPSMRGIAASLTEEDMKKLAEYYGAPAK